MEQLKERSEKEVHLRDYLRVILKRRSAAIAFFVVVVVTITVGSFAMKPIYRATCRVLIERENPNTVKIEEMLAVDANSTDYYQTQYGILESRLLAQRAIKELGLQDQPEFNPKPKKGWFWFNPKQFLATALRKIKVLSPSPADEGEQLSFRENQLINAYVSRLTIKPIRNSRLVDISFDSHDPKLAALLANTHARLYMEYNLERKFIIAQDAVQWLSKKTQEMQKELESTGQGNLGERDNLIAQNLRNLNGTLTQGKTGRDKGRNNLYTELNNKSSQNPSSNESVTKVLENPLIQELKAQLVKLEGELSESSKKYGSKHPQMIRLRSQIAQLRAKIAQEISKITQGVDSEHRIILAKEISLISVVDPARVPDTPARPKKRLNFLLAVVVGLMGGVGLAFFFEYLDPSVKSSEEVEAQLGMPFLGHVENINSMVSSKANGALVTLHHPTSHIAEEFRTIAMNILFSIPDKQGKIIIITSALAEEGKTTTAANLAIVMAQIGKRVLLIDADMRKPIIHTLFDVEKAPGLSDFLAQGANLSSLIVRTSIKDLSIISAGTPPPNPSVLLLSPKMAGFIAGMRKKYDLVILDSPPAMMMSDTPAMAPAADGVVMVIKSGVTPRPTVQKAIQQLVQANAKLTGAVLNCHDIKGEGYYYHYYRDYYHRYYGGSEGKEERV
jgi:succinoglycan biosynthesis transport protein ExoP